MSAGYERFSAQDSSFLVFEDPNTHMHLGGIAIFDPGPLATADGGVDIERIRRHVESRLHWIPRYRQRVAYVPLERHPVWVDDDHFNIHYHEQTEVFYPVKRSAMRGDGGTFAAKTGQDYCWMWTARDKPAKVEGRLETK